MFGIKREDGQRKDIRGIERMGWEGVKHVRKPRACKRIYYFTHEWKQGRKNGRKKRNEMKGGVNEKYERYLRFIHPMQDVPYLGVRNSTLSQRPGRPSSRDDFIARQRETHQKVSNVTCASCRK